MKKVSLSVQSWVLVIARGLTALLAMLCMFLQNTSAAKILMEVIVVFCFLMVIFEFYLARKLYCGQAEEADERDCALLLRAADRAVSLSQLLIGAAAVVFLLLVHGGWVSMERGILFALIGINLPSFLKYAFFLYYEAADEGAYWE